MLLRDRLRRKTVLGVPVPRSLTKRHLPDIDVMSIAKTVGEASQSVAKTSKTVSRDIERAGEDVHQIREQLARLNRQSPLEVVLDGLTHRRGAHRQEG